MSIPYHKEGIFIERINRFVGRVLLDNGEEVLAHIHDSGRLGEILYKGNRVLLQLPDGSSRNRKTKYDIVFGLREDEFILVNTKFHSDIAEILIKRLFNPKRIKREFKFGKSRLDFFVETDTERSLIEVKGVTLIRDRIALFPDAPTERGRKHIYELIEAMRGSGYRAYVIFLVFKKDARCFYPNIGTDQEFSNAFFRYLELGGRAIFPKFFYDLRTQFLVYVGDIDICNNAIF